MLGHSDEFIESRILRKLQSWHLPDGKNVIGCSDASLIPAPLLDIAEAGVVGKPVAIFFRSTSVWTLLGSGAVHCCYENVNDCVQLDDIVDLRIVDSLAEKRTLEFVEVFDSEGGSHVVWGHPYAGCLALAGVLLVLMRMKKGSDPSVLIPRAT